MHHDVEPEVRAPREGAGSALPAELDRRLAVRAGTGDDAAFATLVDRHRAQLVRAVAGRSGRPDLAEDAVQEGLLSAHRALRTGQTPTDVRAWLHTIVWRRALDLARRERAAVPLEDAGAAAHAGQGPEAQVLQASELEDVVAAWAGLPDRQRQALTLSVLEGRSLTEIATALDVNADAAKSLVARGRRTLTERLAIAELGCADVRGEVLASAERGVRLAGDVTRHVRGCRDCSRLHRQARRRRRVRALVVAPYGLLITIEHRWEGARDRVRDLVFTGAGHEPQISLATKLCAAACVGALSGPAAAPTLTALPERSVVAAAAAVAAADQLRAERADANASLAAARRAARAAQRRAQRAAEATAAAAAQARETTAEAAPAVVAAVPTTATAEARRAPRPSVAPTPVPDATQTAGGGGGGESAPAPLVAAPAEQPAADPAPTPAAPAEPATG